MPVGRLNISAHLLALFYGELCFFFHKFLLHMEFCAAKRIFVHTHSALLFLHCNQLFERLTAILIKSVLCRMSNILTHALSG